jgi:1-acyl-sn-glycerol-3-phosphate acyltransferase
MKTRRSDIFYHLVRSIGDLCFRAIYTVRIGGQENIPPRGPAIFLPKHQFWSDIPIVGMALRRPVNYIAKHELFIYPGVRQFISALGGIPINRLNPIKSIDSFRYVEQLLLNGEFIVLFPEGTYYPDTMGRGKHRFIQRILQMQGKMGTEEGKAIPFFPVGIRYEKKSISVQIGAPLFAPGDADPQEFTNRVMERIGNLSGIKIWAQTAGRGERGECREKNGNLS